MENKSIGAWKKQTQKGEVITFTINGQRYAMWPNSRKAKDTHPDYNIVEDNYQPQNKTVSSANNMRKSIVDDGENLPF